MYVLVNYLTADPFSGNESSTGSQVSKAVDTETPRKKKKTRDYYFRRCCLVYQKRFFFKYQVEVDPFCTAVFFLYVLKH